MKRRIAPQLIVAVVCAAAGTGVPLLAAPPPWAPHAGGSRATKGADSAAAIELRTVRVATPEERTRWRGEPEHAHEQGETGPEGTLEKTQSWTPGPPMPSSPRPLRVDAVKSLGDTLHSFEGNTNTGWIPPDSALAVGPEHVLEAVNVGFTVQSKTGRVIRGYTTFDSFFASLKTANWDADGAFMFDPKVYYSWQHQQFVLFCLGRDDVTQKSYFFIAISQTSDATRSWWAWRFDWPETGTWLDYAAISADPWGLYLTGNVFYFGSGDFRYGQLWSLNPAMFSGGASNGWQFTDLRWPITGSPKAFALQAARPQTSASGSESFFVNAFPSANDQVCLWKLTGDRTSSPTLVATAIDVSNYYPVGENVDQPDIADKLDGFSTRAVEAVYSQRRVWVSLTTGENAGIPSWGGMYTARVNVDTQALEWESLIASADQYYIFPAVTVSPDAVSATSPKVAVFGSWAAADQYASSIYYLYNPGGTDSFISYRTGEAGYVSRDLKGINRWGDYSGIAYDTACGTVWGATEYALPDNDWGTRIAEVDFAGSGPCPRIDVTSPTDSSVLYAGNQATITWSGSALAAGNQLFVYLYKSGAYVSQLAGPLPVTATSTTVTMPPDTTTTGQIFVGAWNPTTSSWQTQDWSDAYFTLAGAPDLAVSSFSSPQTRVIAGTSLLLSATVENSGNASSPTSTLRFYRSTNSVISGSDTQVDTAAIGSLAGGGNTSRLTYTTDTGTPGTWYFGGCVDVVAHDPAANNCTSSPIAITVLAVHIFGDSFELGTTGAWSSHRP